MKIGDLITAYKSGIHRIINIQERWEHKDGFMKPYQFELNDLCGRKIGDLVTYVQVANSNGKLINSKKEFSCDICFCKPLENYISSLEEIIVKLKELE